MNVNEAIDDLYTILGQHNGEYMDYASYEAAVDNLNIISNFVAGTRWVPVSERLPTKDDANSKGKIIAWCTSFNGTEVDLNWRLVETSGVITHWRVGMEPPKEVE